MAMIKSNLNTKDLVRDYKKGFSLRKIADIHFSNRTTVREKLIEAGVYQSKSLDKKITKDELVILLSKFTANQIAKLMKVHHSSIYRLIKKYNIREEQSDGRESRSPKSSAKSRSTNSRNKSKSIKRKTKKN